MKREGGMADCFQKAEVQVYLGETKGRAGSTM